MVAFGAVVVVVPLNAEADREPVVGDDVPFGGAIVVVPQRIEGERDLGLPTEEPFIGLEFPHDSFAERGPWAPRKIAAPFPCHAADIEEFRIFLPDVVRPHRDLRVVRQVAIRGAGEAVRAVVEGVEVKLDRIVLPDLAVVGLRVLKSLVHDAPGDVEPVRIRDRSPLHAEILFNGREIERVPLDVVLPLKTRASPRRLVEEAVERDGDRSAVLGGIQVDARAVVQLPLDPLGERLLRDESPLQREPQPDEPSDDRPERRPATHRIHGGPPSC